MINVEEFVAESLGQIVRGIKKAQTEVAESGAKINPTGTILSANGTLTIHTDPRHLPNGHMVEFDIAVVATEDESIKGGLGIFGGALGVGYQAAKGQDNSTVSRIKFSIPVFWPEQKN